MERTAVSTFIAPYTHGWVIGFYLRFWHEVSGYEAAVQLVGADLAIPATAVRAEGRFTGGLLLGRLFGWLSN
jgi:hypothetical protein